MAMHRLFSRLPLILAMAWGALAFGQQGDQALKAQADALFDQGQYAKALPLYTQLVSLSPQDHELNYKLGACTIFGGGDKAKAIGYLRYAIAGPATPKPAWYFLGRAYQLDYRFNDALEAYKHFKGTADKKQLAAFPVDALEQQARNGKYLLSNLKDVEVLNKLEVDAQDFFRFYDLSDIGGKIVVTPEELLSPLDKKSKEQFLVYLPTEGGPIYFSSYGKDGRTGRDIYRTHVLPTGGYAIPEKLGSYINTSQDEDFGVMAPDGRTFYFCSKGHNSMGGYDVFRSVYDPGLDIFSAPENMDFAVNTPSDEMLYIVGPDGGQACFASNRDSRQSQLNVYRVGTTQTPLNLTVLKGVYVSTGHPEGTRARIVVEDELTRAKVAEAYADANGEYLLVLPRGGKYKFVVEDGNSQRTYWSEVDAPPANMPQAFAQKITLDETGAGKLLVESRFNEPLDVDVMELALDEVRRRARLDITGESPVVASGTARAAQDPMAAAGFDGMTTLADAMRMADADAQALQQQASSEEEQARSALALARADMDLAESEAAATAALLAQAAKTGNAEERARLYREAAERKQASEDAGLRTLAALHTVRAMQTASARTATRAATASGLAITLRRETEADNRTRLTESLKQLKTRLDEKKRADGPISAMDQLRQQAKDLQDRAAKEMRQALAMREEEGRYADRVANAERSAATAKGTKRTGAEKNAAEMRAQSEALQEETAAAFRKAEATEQEASLAQGQVALVQYMAGGTMPAGAEPLSPSVMASLEQRLAQVKQQNQALAIGQEYLPAAISAAERQRRTFAWGASPGAARTATVATRTAPGHAATELESGVHAGDLASAAHVAIATAEEKPDRETTGTEQVQQGLPPQTQRASDARTDQTATHDLPRTAISGQEVGHDVLIETGPDRAGEPDPPLNAATVSYSPDLSEQAFVLANGLAELEQARAAERNKARRDSLDLAIAAQKARIAQFREGQNEDPLDARYNAPAYAYLDHDPALLEAQLIEEAYPGFKLALEQARNAPGNDQEKAARIHALEMQLIDSIDAHVQMGLAYLDEHPDEAAEILPKLDQWRQLKEARVQEAGRVLASAGQSYGALESDSIELEQIQAMEKPSGASAAGNGQAPLPERYVSIDPDLEKIYTSPLEARSPKSQEALAQKDADLEKAAIMQARIDSMQEVLADVVAGKEYEKLRERIDRQFDDLLIHNVDLGQRMAFISRSEFALAQDSAKILAKRIAQKGTAPDEPLTVLAVGMQREADAAMGRAKSLRKQADNASDIFKRNSLYRQAYAQELGALRDMDRSHTVRNFMLDPRWKPGMSATYAEIERMMFPPKPAAGPVLAQQEQAADRGVAERSSDTGAPHVGASTVSSGMVTLADTASSPVQPARSHMPVADSVALAKYLDRFYYVVPDERQTVLATPDQARYFLMKGSALQDRADAALAQEEAEAGRQLAQALGSGPETPQHGEDSETAGSDRLRARVTALQQRSDSLGQVSKRLLERAERTDDQSAAWLATLEPERSTALMNLEQARRRTEPMLARIRPAAPAPTSEVPATVARPTRAATATNVAEESGNAQLRTTPSAPVDTMPDQVAAPHERPVHEAASRLAARDPMVGHAVSPAIPVDVPLQENHFAIQADAAPREGPIPMDVPMPIGVVYKVQVGAFRNALPEEAFSDMTPVSGEQAGNGLVRYTAGMFTTAEAARDAGAKVRARGYRDAFVVAYMDGQRVSLRQAMQAELQQQVQGAQHAAMRPAETPPPAEGPLGAQASATAPGRTVELVPGQGTVQPAAAVLAEYPATAEEVLATFNPSAEAASYYNDPTAAPAKQVETIKGLFFTVQVGVYSKPTALDKLFNITPLNSELTANGKIRYTTGFFLGETQAADRRTGAIGLGVTDAFVTAYLNGKRIPLRDARALLDKFGHAILADPKHAQ